MNILIVSSFLPFPLYSGGHVRLFNIIKELSKHHTITLVCEKRNYQIKKDINELSNYCKQIFTFDRKKQWSVSNILKTGISSSPFLLIGHTQPEMKKKIEELLKTEKFDLVHAETFYIMHNIPTLLIPLILAEHNIEYLVYERFANNASAFLRPLLMIDIKKLKKWEEYYWKKADKLVAVSEQDKAIMRRADVEVVKNGVDLTKFRIQNSEFRIKEKRILFIGDFKWIQNKDAVTWILKEIWPKVTNNSELIIHNLKLWIVGKNIPESIKNMTDDKNVIFDESADETSKLFQKAYILIAPIRVGGGTSFKILEAMASGVPVVTTGIGAEGLQVQDEKHILIADDTQGFIDAISQLIQNPNKYEEISYNARKLIEKEYDWKIIVQKLEEVYESAVNKS